MFESNWLRIIALLMALAAGSAAAHALPEQQTPGAGATLKQMPATVSIRFDSELEPLFSKLIVKNEQDMQISQGNGSVDPTNGRLLVTHVSGAARGRCHVYWSVVARDGHRTEGDYSFTVE